MVVKMNAANANATRTQVMKQVARNAVMTFFVIPLAVAGLMLPPRMARAEDAAPPANQAVEVTVVRALGGAASRESVASGWPFEGYGTVMWAEFNGEPFKWITYGITDKFGVTATSGFGEEMIGLKLTEPIGDWKTAFQVRNYNGRGSETRNDLTLGVRGPVGEDAKLALDYNSDGRWTARLDRRVSNRVNFSVKGAFAEKENAEFTLGADFLTGRSTQVGLYGLVGEGWDDSNFSVYWAKTFKSGNVFQVDVGRDQWMVSMDFAR